MRKEKAFTLVELLTVISIIAILMAIILPALSGVRRRAKASVCLSNLRQWGLVYKMYTDEFDGQLPHDYGEFAWYYPIRNYYSKEPKILLCPAAKKASDPDGTMENPPYGGTFVAWGRFGSQEERPEWDTIGSYGLNKWAYKPVRDTNNTDTGIEVDPGTADDYKPPIGTKPLHPKVISRIRTHTEDVNEQQNQPLDPSSRYWETAYESKAHNIPLVSDCGWLYSSFNDNAGPPSKDDSTLSHFGQTNTICIDRHDGGINILFMDFSTRKAGLKELWTLKWHKQFNTTGKWTTSGGVTPELWPKWMKNFKDYNP